MNALEADGISMRFGGLRAVDDVSLCILPGERHAIIGTNGAGKTTLFNVFTGQLTASTGRLKLWGEDITRLPIHARAGRGMARTFQITNLFGGLTVYETMLIAVQALSARRFVFFRSVWSFQELVSATRRLLESWDLWRWRDLRVSELSYGTQRQIEIALALASKPRLLLLDEPMAGLSAKESLLAADIISNLDRTLTVVMIEHDLPAVFRIADRITAMDRGRVVAVGTPDEIRRESALQAIYQVARPQENAP